MEHYYHSGTGSKIDLFLLIEHIKRNCMPCGIYDYRGQSEFCSKVIQNLEDVDLFKDAPIEAFKHTIDDIDSMLKDLAHTPTSTCTGCALHTLRKIVCAEARQRLEVLLDFFGREKDDE